MPTLGGACPAAILLCLIILLCSAGVIGSDAGCDSAVLVNTRHLKYSLRPWSTGSTP